MPRMSPWTPARLPPWALQKQIDKIHRDLRLASAGDEEGEEEVEQEPQEQQQEGAPGGEQEEGEEAGEEGVDAGGTLGAEEHRGRGEEGHMSGPRGPTSQTRVRPPYTHKDHEIRPTSQTHQIRHTSQTHQSDPCQTHHS